jgi:hypothetical protein
VRWLRNTLEVKDTDNYLHYVDRKTGTLKLTINEVRESDRGEYMVLVLNAAGSDRSTAMLHVDGN